MGLAEQIFSVITIAIQPIRLFKFKKLSIETVKPYINELTQDISQPYLLAIYESLKAKCFRKFTYYTLTRKHLCPLHNPP